MFVFNKGDSYDTVWDFSAAEGDKVRIDPALAGSFAEFQSHLSGFTFEGADFTVFLSADGLDQRHAVTAPRASQERVEVTASPSRTILVTGRAITAAVIAANSGSLCGWLAFKEKGRLTPPE